MADKALAPALLMILRPAANVIAVLVPLAVKVRLVGMVMSADAPVVLAKMLPAFILTRLRLPLPPFRLTPAVPAFNSIA